MPPILVSSGEPAGIGPDIIIQAAHQGLIQDVVVMADISLLKARAALLGLELEFHDYEAHRNLASKPHRLCVWHKPLAVNCSAGKLNRDNAPYVLSMLRDATEACMRGEFSAFVTAPVHKAVINQAGMAFSGHTEFLAELTGVDNVVMMLACSAMKVALVTTHLPLAEVALAITADKIETIVDILARELQDKFGLSEPQIFVAGLNPHAGEGGYMGREEIDIIEPVLDKLRQRGLCLHGPLPADTMFTPPFVERADAFLAMYHDQGLSVLKYAGFGESVNITLGLPIIRTSVDHGTALDLAGTGKSRCGSLIKAIEMADTMRRGGKSCQ